MKETFTAAERRFVDSLVARRKCPKCQQPRNENEYTITEGNYIRLCNTCRVAQNQQKHAATGAVLYFKEDTDWQRLGACVQCSDPDVFFPDKLPVGPQSWDSICGQCPVQEQCLSFGLEYMFEGVWGGVWLAGSVSSLPEGSREQRQLAGAYKGPLQLGSQCPVGHSIQSWDDVLLNKDPRQDRVVAKCRTCVEAVPDERSRDVFSGR